MYEPSSASRKFICDMMNTWLLVNIVHNDFKDPTAIFEPFFKAAAEYAAKYGVAPAVAVNGDANGHSN